MWNKVADPEAVERELFGSKENAERFSEWLKSPEAAEHFRKQAEKRKLERYKRPKVMKLKRCRCHCR